MPRREDSNIGIIPREFRLLMAIPRNSSNMNDIEVFYHF